MTIDKEIFLYVRFIVHSCSSDSDGFSDLHTSWNLCSIWQTLKNARSSVIYICFTKILMNSIVLLFKSMATIQWLTADFTAKLLISNVKGSCTFWLFVFMLLFYLSLSDSFFPGFFLLCCIFSCPVTFRNFIFDIAIIPGDELEVFDETEDDICCFTLYYCYLKLERIQSMLFYFFTSYINIFCKHDGFRLLTYLSTKVMS